MIIGNFKVGYHYKKAGVVLMEIVPDRTRQLSVFQETDEKHSVLIQAVDNLNDRLGQQKIKYGCQNLQRTWKMRQFSLSPCYTIRISDIIEVKI